jgi:hypothetical protein
LRREWDRLEDDRWRRMALAVPLAFATTVAGSGYRAIACLAVRTVTRIEAALAPLALRAAFSVTSIAAATVPARAAIVAYVTAIAAIGRLQFLVARLAYKALTMPSTPVAEKTCPRLFAAELKQASGCLWFRGRCSHTLTRLN